ncbi:MAG TPA: hypothetical protein P5528_09835, partial [Steroidobacteraceae bacterium]|nr:hypothetical protein [Steroidobacteraceae bacterium]
TLLASALLVACGGTGSSDTDGSATINTPGSAPPRSPSQSTALPAEDLAIATRLYRGDERTPPGFVVEPRPANVLGLVSTRHLRNTDIDSGTPNNAAHFELCTNDTAQAIEWSEQNAAWNGQYSDLVQVDDNARYIEVSRVPRADVTALLRQRVFRCDYLDRSGSDLRVEQGTAGVLRVRPIDGSVLRTLVEYLWQFTPQNNANYVVVSSASDTSATHLSHQLELGELIRATASGCDTVRVSDWTHTADVTSGALHRSVAVTRSFSVRDGAHGAEACTE